MPYIGRSSEFGVRQVYTYTPSAGDTSVGGADVDGKTLSFNDGRYAEVYLNGIKLKLDTDYNVNTANTAATNAANQINAANYLNVSNTALNNIWQQFRDEADYAYSSAENSADRAFHMATAILEADINKDQYNAYLDQQTGQAIGGFLTSLIPLI